MNRIIALFFAVIALSVPALAASDGDRTAHTRYLSAINDLPLTGDLLEITDSAMVFDKPEGRIVRVSAEGTTAPDDIHRFYADTLPQLGWEPFGQTVLGPKPEDEEFIRYYVMRFDRGQEMLIIYCRLRADGRILVSYELGPAASS
jgi:hypothetical protein